jgi:hypothetical protein
MRVRFHPGFALEVKQIAGQYAEVSARLAVRFRREVDEAIKQIKESPARAGHFLNTGSQIVREVRRRNLVSFPFFILYGLHDELLVFGALIPGKSDPLLWLKHLTNVEK